MTKKYKTFNFYSAFSALVMNDRLKHHEITDGQLEELLALVKQKGDDLNYFDLEKLVNNW